MVKKWTLTGIEPRNPKSEDRRLNHYTMSGTVRMVTTFELTVLRVFPEVSRRDLWRGDLVKTNEIRLLSSIDGFWVNLRYKELILERILWINNYE